MKPTFIGIGAPRCGTTSVYYYLRQHPQVFMSPRKETDFFTFLAGRDPSAARRLIGKEPVTTWREYEGLFADGAGRRTKGEISPSYFWWPGIADVVHSALPQVSLFCILRNPIERAYSSYRMHVDIGDETRTFEQAVSSELNAPVPESTVVTDRYVRIGLYAASLARWLELFGSRQVQIFFYDDLEADPDRFMQEMFSFLEVDPLVAVDTSTRFNTYSTNKVERRLLPRTFHNNVKILRRLIPQRMYVTLYRAYSRSLSRATGSPTVPAWAREQLRAVYAPDIRQLEALTGRDLSHWLHA